jgi:hypothetical protein
MQQLFYSLAVLACPIGMGLMMWMMMRGQRNNPDNNASNARGATSVGQPDSAGQVALLRAEIDQLKVDRAKNAH